MRSGSSHSAEATEIKRGKDDHKANITQVIETEELQMVAVETIPSPRTKAAASEPEARTSNSGANEKLRGFYRSAPAGGRPEKPPRGLIGGINAPRASDHNPPEP